MKIGEFIHLSEDSKVRHLRRDGVYIGKRQRKGMQVVLYQLNDFYVEIYYDSYRKYINRFHCFESTAFLDPYLDKMDIGVFV